ncbi:MULTISPECIES: tripartite tricarboxylate transporter TctB family protein [Brenneria]|uniref:Tripartite tricarboxylate transporter TctB family protein n=1 Tax=Brenneria nigrifluens DSM 30175 = ATCC 13028 TaxID=1121120 RepID=A0A2U1UGV4_9GAMM|nr:MULTISPECIES: tripartite tricarboxylate transporter TctB family protein [Brenneria]EHD19957.1 putative transporter [Brenneria sp. EniD312]PWC20910.1 tripartite tricarboxylate transporter TctB family protein [Brenneria nigrifluens DSM 30175 = ATCC 13028]QCR03202.1 tripartite tricarboxylate transporter TctB family protein [Brenneria nigrifluens DSM 30175 = ATCC 13028]
MRIVDHKSFLTGVFYSVVGAGGVGYSSLYSLGNLARIGPGYFPLALSALLLLLGGIISLRSVRLSKPDVGKSPRRAPVFDWRGDIFILLWILASVLMFAFLLPTLGLVLAIPLLVILLGLASHNRHYRQILLNAFFITLLSLAVFIYGLGLLLPLWPRLPGGA